MLTHSFVVQSLNFAQLFATPWAAAHQASLSITNSQSLLTLMSIQSVMPSNHLILCRPLLLPPSILRSIRVFSNESALRIMWPKYWSFSFSINPSSKYSGLISFRVDWLDLLVVQRTLKNLLHHGSKASIFSAWIYSRISSHFKVSPDWLERWCLGRAETGATLRDSLGGRSVARLNFRDSNCL